MADESDMMYTEKITRMIVLGVVACTLIFIGGCTVQEIYVKRLLVNGGYCETFNPGSERVHWAKCPPESK